MRPQAEYPEGINVARRVMAAASKVVEGMPIDEQVDVVPRIAKTAPKHDRELVLIRLLTDPRLRMWHKTGHGRFAVRVA